MSAPIFVAKVYVVNLSNWPFKEDRALGCYANETLAKRVCNYVSETAYGKFPGGIRITYESRDVEVLKTKGAILLKKNIGYQSKGIQKRFNPDHCHGFVMLMAFEALSELPKTPRREELDNASRPQRSG